MTKVGRKFRTLHKFGKRKRKSKVAKKNIVTTETVTVAESEEPTASTSTGFPTLTATSSVASSRKLQYFKARKQETDSSESSNEEICKKKKEVAGRDEPELQGVGDQNLNIIINMSCLQACILAWGIVCLQCGEQTLVVAEGGPERRMGSACLLTLRCSKCGELSSQYMSPKTGTIHTGNDVNRRIVAAATTNGIGFSQMKRFFAMMAMPPPMSGSLWYELKRKLHPATKRAADRHLQEAAEQVRAAYADTNIGIPDRDGVLDIAVSIDGSWQKRGRTSHNGIVTVIEILTGLIVDFVALSNYCHECDTGPVPEDPAYEEFIAKHRGRCQKNIQCSSGAMEMEGAVIIFKRSVRLHGFRYSQMLGDLFIC